MSTDRARVLLVSPLPAPALHLVADVDVDVDEHATTVSEHHRVILSGSVSGEAVAEVAAELSRRPELRVCVDLANPPTEAALAPLRSFCHGGHTRIGDLPVALVSTTGERAFEPEDAGALAGALADREQRVAELEARVRRLRSRVRRTQARLAQLERHPALRAARVYRTLARGVPGGAWTLLLAAALLLVAVGVLLVTWPVLGLALLIVACSGLTLAGLAVVAVSAQRLGTQTVDRGQSLERQPLAEQAPAALPDARPVTASQVQDLVHLFSRFPVPARVPPMGGWAASGDLVEVLLDELLRLRPGLVVECGSGVSTLWLALAAEHHGLDTRIVSLEHQPAYARSTRELLRSHGVAHRVDVRQATLADPGIADHGVPWYALDAVADLDDIGLLFVDGPPAATGSQARYPAVGLLHERLARRSTVLLDDALRQDEQKIAARWATLLPDHVRTDLALEKGAVLFRRS